MTTLQIIHAESIIGYTPLVLFILGTMGILLHNLVELNKINKANGGDVKIGKYLQHERFSIAISIIVVIACVITSQEIKMLEQVGKWLGLAFVAIGYMGQSLLIFSIGKAEKAIGKN